LVEVLRGKCDHLFANRLFGVWIRQRLADDLRQI